jgi:uncharacterized protein DUF4157
MRTLAVQRCARGGHAPPGGECARCRAKRLATQSSLVTETLRGSGRPLDPTTRSGFESALGQDFGNVRVHTDARAATSAAALDANAYTVGTHVVFGAGRYDPGSAAGRRLLGHELTHVRQQAGASLAGPLQVVDDPVAEAEANSSARTITRRLPAAVQRQALPDIPPESIGETALLGAPPIVRFEPAPLVEPQEQLPDFPATPLQGPTPTTPKPPPRCLPDRPLKWDDFTVGNPGRRFGALTDVPISEETVQGKPMFRALMNHGTSKVLAKVPAASDRMKNGCAADVDQCKQVFKGGRMGDFRRTPPTRCDAAVFTKSTAANPRECESVIGADCDSDAVAESARLLRHEQGHFDITCKLVGRADDALAAGRPYSDVKRWLNKHNKEQQDQYEGDSEHGCVGFEQDKWEKAIAGGLQALGGP